MFRGKGSAGDEGANSRSGRSKDGKGSKAVSAAESDSSKKKETAGVGSGGAEAEGGGEGGEEEVIPDIVQLVDGDYSVQVHLLEARDLKPRDMSGTSDPICQVEAFGTKYATKVKKKTLSCVWDQTFFYEKRGAKVMDIECAKINVSVFDHNAIGRNQLIGSYEFGMGYIYRQPNHELWMVWVPLTDVTDKNEGIQGYVKLSVTVLGPNDEMVIHTEEEIREQEGNQKIIMSPKIKQEGHLLMVVCYKAESLPKFDRFGKSDPFISVLFAGNPACKTSTKEKSLNPVWNERLEVPVMLPIMTDMIEIILWDREKVGSNRRMATLIVPYSSIPKGKRGEDEKQERTKPRWYTLYGPPLGHSGKEVDAVRNGRSDGTCYYGRLQLKIYDIQKDDPERAVTKIDVPLADLRLKMVEYYVALDIYDVVELPFEGDKVQVVLSWGEQQMKSETAVVRNGKAVIGSAFPTMKGDYPEDPAECPDVFIYIERVDIFETPTRLAYIRFKISNLLETSEGPDWYDLKEDKVINAVPKGEYPGSALMKINGGKAHGFFKRSRLIPWKLNSYLIRANFYQGRNLLAADDDGTSDPFIVMKVGGQKYVTKTRPDTLFPVWNEVLEAPAQFPETLSYAPDIQLQVFDFDKGEDPTLIGRFSIPVENLKAEPDAYPTWHSLALDDYAGPTGDILASFQLIPQNVASKYPKVDITPPKIMAKFEIFVIGLRNMQPYKMLPTRRPYIQFVVGDGKKNSFKTERSNIPNGSDPNFLKTITFEVELPEDKYFTPNMNIRVYDNPIRGAPQPLIGVASLNLQAYVSWMTHEESTQGSPKLEPKKTVKKRKKLNINPLTSIGSILTGSDGDYDEIGSGEDSESASLLSSVGSTISKAAGVARNATAAVVGGVSSLFQEQIHPPDDFEVRVNIEDQAKPEYLKDRLTIDNELEDVYNLVPFHEVYLTRGMQISEHNDLFSEPEGSVLGDLLSSISDEGIKNVGKFKGFVRISSADTPAAPPPFDLQSLMGIQTYIVRIYVIKAMALASNDDDGQNDSFVAVELGGEKISRSDNYKENTNEPEYYETFELETTLPGPSILTVGVYDYDIIGANELIGSTEIDLENRWFSQEWKAFKKKPLENRTLRLPSSAAPKGKIQLWVDIFPKSDAANHPLVDISPPPKKDFEVRLIIWNARYMAIKDSITKQNDLFITAEITGCKKQQTDVHFRSKEGKGSFNYRLIFPIQLPVKNPRLKFAAWDFDIFAPNDLIGETEIALRDLFLAAYYKEMPIPLSRVDKKDDDEAEKPPTRDPIWVEIFHSETEQEPQGQICFSLEVVPKAFAEANPAGPKRDEPNQNPVLDPPDRVKFDIFSPLVMLKELLGPELYGRIVRPIVCICCFMLFAGFGFVLNQFAGIIAVVK